MINFLDEKEAQSKRAMLEKEMQSIGQENLPVDLSPEEQKQIIKDFYNLMDYILDFYMDIPKETKNLVILWTIGTYFHKDFETFPYLFINAMRSSGKTRLLKIIEAFSDKGQLSMSMTEAVLFRTTGTLLIDEFEGVNRKGVESLKELLNSAYKKGTKVFRMKKKKTIEGESQVVEDFQPYRPIVMANITGIEEVLSDRCINLYLEKSSDISKTKLVEAFSNFASIKAVKERLKGVVRCSVVTSQNVHLLWNEYVKEHITTPNYISTLTTLNYTKLHQNELEVVKIDQMMQGKDVFNNFNDLFDKIFNSGVDGRHLELFFPLYLIADQIGETTLNETITTSQKIVNDKKVDEIAESRDVVLYNLISLQKNDEWVDVSSLVAILKMTLGEGENDWLNSKWMGRALKRLSLVTQKRRTKNGIQVLLDTEKAKKKKELFEPKDA